MKRLFGTLLIASLLALAPSTSGCGGCLSSAEAQDKINDIASGAESSSGEVAAKQEEIRQVHEDECGPGEE